MSLEGTLYCRKGQNKSWRRRLVVLTFDDFGGSLECYKVIKEGPKQVLKEMYSELHRQNSVRSTIWKTSEGSGSQTLKLALRADMPWVVRDIENDQSAFVIEIPTEDPELIHDLTFDNDDEFGRMLMEHNDHHDSGDDEHYSFDNDHDGPSSDDGCDSGVDEYAHRAFAHVYGDDTVAAAAARTTTNSNRMMATKQLQEEAPFDALANHTLSHFDPLSEPRCDPSNNRRAMTKNNNNSISSQHHSPVKMNESSKIKLEKDFKYAQKKHRPMRLYFKCPRRGNEKALWLRGFMKLNRLSPEPFNKRKFLGRLAHIGAATSRIRRDVAEFTRDLRHLDMGVGNSMLSPIYQRGGASRQNRNNNSSNNGNGENNSSNHISADNYNNNNNQTTDRTLLLEETAERREFHVYPNYCYPHVWMTQNELLEDCNLPSTKFHDLRIDEMRGKEIGTLSVEVLQCVGLPRLDRGSDSDAVVYLVCGSYAFATDVIPNNSNPIWLRKSRRACTIPIFHGYSRLFVGVFDDDSGFRDDMAGRAVLDLANLRPQSRYDVTVPLRMSAHVYSRKQRGAIRLRFQLDWHDERAALTSYLPSSWQSIKHTIQRRNDANTNTTVMCTDPEAFRNIAMTVHGAHLPDKFNMNRFRATIKEVTFSRKMAMATFKGTIRETMNWQHPAISLFVFCGWMHCIYINSFGLVPAYSLSFIMLHMLRTYVRYGIDGPSSRGFVPPTWEEMLLAVSTGKPCIKPISMMPAADSAGFRSPLDTDDDDFPAVRHNIKTHTPCGKSLFRTLGFLESDDALRRIDPNERHIEFPFAVGEIYPKLTVRDAKAIKEGKGAKHNQELSTQDGISVNPKAKKKNARAKHRHAKDHLDDASIQTDDPYGAAERRRFSSGEDEMFIMDHSGVSEENSSEHNNSSSPLNQIVEIPSNTASALPPMYPDQDIDYKHSNSGDKKMTDDLEEIRENLHRLTWNLFNDKTYVIKHPEAQYFGQSKKGTKTKRDVNRDLQKCLNEGTYSTSNPIVSRIAPYMIPLIGGAMSFLSVFRTLFNIFTWRDRFLSFWVSLFGLILAIVLFIFPWRPFLLVVGFVVVGPQNLIYRLVRERRGVVPKVEKVAVKEGPYKLPTDQPLFKCHPLPNQRYEDIDVSKVDAREVHHVVVPYAPLAAATNRFNDWPPEQEFAHIRPKPKRFTGDNDTNSSNGQQYKLSTVPGGVPSVIAAGAAARRRSLTTEMSLPLKAAGVTTPLRRRSQTVDTLQKTFDSKSPKSKRT